MSAHKKLFLVTHKANRNPSKTYIAAINMELVARNYDVQNIELISDKIMVLKTPEDYDT